MKLGKSKILLIENAKNHQLILMDKNFLDEVSSEFINDLLSYKSGIFIKLIDKKNTEIDLQIV